MHAESIWQLLLSDCGELHLCPRTPRVWRTAFADSSQSLQHAVPSQRDLDLLQHALACSFICKLAVTPQQQLTSCVVRAMQTLQLVVLQTVSCRCKAWVALATGLQHNRTSPCLPKDDILNKSKQFLTCMRPLASLP